MRLLVWPGPAYWGIVVVGRAGSGAGGGRRVITVEVTALLASGRPSRFLSA
ncbi:hypothetical protein [Streptomyces sp. NPDC048577]|uniref:hypothetical protein n=1 Tax=Streptomyces sp. NPDC048577 TaxID=3157209 RepID=UPI003445A614